MGLLPGNRAKREFDAFTAKTTSQLLRTATLMVWDASEAEDLVQEVLLQVARRWPRVRSMDHPASYARTILVGLVFEGAAKRRRRHRELAPSATGDLEELGDPTPGQSLTRIDDRAELVDLLATLPTRQRTVLVLRYWEGLPEAEVARLMGCPVGTVKSTASRALALLRRTAGQAPDMDGVVPVLINAAPTPKENHHEQLD